MNKIQMNDNETRSRKRKIILKTGAIVGLVITVTAVILFKQIPVGSYGRTGMIFTSFSGVCLFLNFFLQLRQKDSDN